MTATFSFDLLMAGLTTLFGGVGIGILLAARRTLRGTTLWPAALWATFSLASLTVSEVVVTLLDAAAATGNHVPAIRFAAGATTFCPMMAVLGAKRPQARGWQFIVATLLILLAIPALQAVLFFSGPELYVAPVWSWLLSVLMLMELTNHLPTRYWPSVLLVVAGQSCLVADVLPLLSLDSIVWLRALAAPLFCLALLLVRSGFPVRRSIAHELDGLWIDFRDWFGAAWALRLAERLRATAESQGWDIRVTYGGIANSTGGQIRPETAAAVERFLRSILRRFVSVSWIAQRLDHP